MEGYNSRPVRSRRRSYERKSVSYRAKLLDNLLKKIERNKTDNNNNENSLHSAKVGHTVSSETTQDSSSSPLYHSKVMYEVPEKISTWILDESLNGYKLESCNSVMFLWLLENTPYTTHQVTALSSILELIPRPVVTNMELNKDTKTTEGLYGLPATRLFIKFV